jgi:hypothetical protein
LTRFYLALLFSSDNYLILLSKASSLTRKRVCSLQRNHSLAPITIFSRLVWDCVPFLPFLSPLTTRRDYGGSILTRLHTGHRPTVITRASKSGGTGFEVANDMSWLRWETSLLSTLVQHILIVTNRTQKNNVGVWQWPYLLTQQNTNLPSFSYEEYEHFV